MATSSVIWVKELFIFNYDLMKGLLILTTVGNSQKTMPASYAPVLCSAVCYQSALRHKAVLQAWQNPLPFAALTAGVGLFRNGMVEGC